MRIFVQNCHCCLFGYVLPVVAVLAGIPLGTGIFICLSVGFIFKVIGNDSVIILITLSDPRKSIKIILFGNIAIVPHIFHMTHGIGLGTVDIYHYLDTVGTALTYNIVKYLKAVHAHQIVVSGVIEVCCGILPRRPAVDKLSGYWHSQKIKASVCDLGK